MNNPAGNSRREFLSDLGKAAAVSFVAAEVSAAAAPASAPAFTSSRGDPSGVGIARLRLRSSKIDELRPFYAQTLGLPVSNIDGGAIAIRAGATEIIFEPTTPTAPPDPAHPDATSTAPYYHFAFNIPENKLAEAKAWLVQRCPLVKSEAGLDEFSFPRWNAHSIYFLDPAGNILEFIARHNLANAGTGEFTIADILYASEIGVVVDDVRAGADAASVNLGLEVFAGSFSDVITALGDDHRLLIIVKRGRPWFPRQDQPAEVHPLAAELRGGRAGRFSLPDFPYDITGGV